jgi:hypothetical protein
MASKFRHANKMVVRVIIANCGRWSAMGGGNAGRGGRQE